MRYPSILLLASVLSALLPAPLGAQEHCFSLEECVRYAEMHNAGIRGSEAEAEVAMADYRDAIGALLPNVSAGTSAYINFGRGIDPTTNTYTTINSFKNSYNIQGSLLLFDGLSSVYELKGRRSDQLSADEQLRKTVRDVRMSAIEAYYNLLYTKELRRLSVENLRNSSELARQAERMYELGMKAPADVAEARATMANDKKVAIDRNNQLEIALLQLKAVMNYPIDSLLVVTDSLTYGEVSPTLLRADEVYPQALHSLPEARISEYQTESLRNRYLGSKGAFAPRISLFAGFDTGFSFFMDGSPYESFADQLRNRRGGYVGVSLTFDLFTGMRKVNGLKRARAQYIAGQHKQEEENRALYKSIQEAILNHNAAVETYRAALENAGHLKVVFDTAYQNYKVGHASSLDLSIASARYKEARAEVAHAYTMCLLRRKWVKYYTTSNF